MRVGSTFTGVGGIDLGLERAGHEIVFQCEADPYRRRVLARHWPGIPIYEDVREIAPGGIDRRPRDLAGIGDFTDPQWARQHAAGAARRDHGPVDLLCGGFPCQDLSVAGRRRGLAGERSGLFFEFARVADALLGAGGWLLIENVPGLLSSHDGRDFAVLLATLAELGFHDLAWRVLDSRYFGVPQRRRRVFIVARRARGRRAAAVLFEPEGRGGDLAPGAEEGPQLAASLSRGSSSAGVSAPGRRQEDDTNLVARSLTGHHGRSDGDTEDFVVNALDRRRGGADDNDAQAGHLVAGTVRSHPRPGSADPGLCAPVDADGVRAPSGLPRRVDVGAVMAYTERIREGLSVPEAGDVSLRGSTGKGGGGQKHFIQGAGEESDRSALDLQPDGPRYAACGDAVSVPVATWIGERFAAHG